jgi:hypothetical protein
VSYVLAVKCTEPLAIGGPDGLVRASAEQLAGGVPAEQWVTASAGHGAKGRRLYDWTWVDLSPPAVAGMGRWLLVRRRRSDGELAFYACYAPAGTPMIGLVGWPGAGGRWRCVNRGALIYADWLGDLGSRCGLVIVRRSSVGGCTSPLGGTDAGGARRAGGGQRG